MTQEMEIEKRVSFFRKVFRVVFWPVRRWKNAAITFIALVIVHTVADQVLLAKLAAQREAARAAGQATSLTDFQIKDLTDDKNAAVVCRYAYSLIEMPSGADFDRSNVWHRYTTSDTCDCRRPVSPAEDNKEPSGPLTTEEMAAVDTFVASNARAYEAIRDACARPACQFGDYEDPQAVTSDNEARLKDLTHVRQLARLIALRAVWEARHGNTDDAYEWVRTGLHLANDLANDPLVIHGLVRIASAEIALDSLVTVLCETPWPATLPEGLNQELIRLADRRAFARCFEAELCYAAESVKTFWKVPRVFRPVSQTPILLAMEKAETDVLTAVREPDPEKRRAAIGDVRAEYTPGKGIRKVVQYYKIMPQITVPALLRAAEAFDRMEAQTQGARQALALKRYKQEHGQYPEQLQELVSFGMMDALPLDPFSGEPFRYKKEGEGFMVYSLGPDRRDDAGTPLSSKRTGDIVWCAAQ